MKSKGEEEDDRERRNEEPEPSVHSAGTCHVKFNQARAGWALPSSSVKQKESNWAQRSLRSERDSRRRGTRRRAKTPGTAKEERGEEEAAAGAL